MKKPTRLKYEITQLDSGEWAFVCCNDARNPRRITPPVGEINPAAKLTWNDVRRLRAAWLAGATTTELASRFAISRTTAHRAATGATWR